MEEAENKEIEEKIINDEVKIDHQSINLSKEEKSNLQKEDTKSSKPSTMNTQVINTKIENYISDDLKDLKHQLILITNKLDTLKFTVKENSREIDYNRHKIFGLLKSGKAQLDSYDKRTNSLRRDIKKARDRRPSITSKNLKKQVQRFQSPKVEGGKNNALAHTKSFNHRISSQNVSLELIIFRKP